MVIKEGRIKWPNIRLKSLYKYCEVGSVLGYAVMNLEHLLSLKGPMDWEDYKASSYTILKMLGDEVLEAKKPEG